MINKLTNDMLIKILNEMKKKNNIKKIHDNLVDPLIYYTFTRMYPYLLIIFSMFIMVFILTILILIFLIKIFNNKNI